MIGFLLKAGAAGVVAYGVTKVLEHYQVTEKVTAWGVGKLDEVLTGLDKVTLSTQTPVPAQAPPPAPEHEYGTPNWRTP